MSMYVSIRAGEMKKFHANHCREGSSLVPLLSDSTKGNWQKTVAFYQFKRRNSMGYSVVRTTDRYTYWTPINIRTKEVPSSGRVHAGGATSSVLVRLR